MRAIRILPVVFAVCLQTTLPGFRPISVSEVNGAMDVAINGYDTVAYFAVGKAVPGRAIFRHEWQGAFWYFSKASHRNQFAAEPEKYAPAYGGYCGYCVSENGEAAMSGDPEIFVIHKGRLYLLQSEQILDTWKKDIERYTAEADKVYAGLLTDSAETASALQ